MPELSTSRILLPHMCMNVISHKGKHSSFPFVFSIESETLHCSYPSSYFKGLVCQEVNLLDTEDVDFLFMQRVFPLCLLIISYFLTAHAIHTPVHYDK